MFHSTTTLISITHARIGIPIGYALVEYADCSTKKAEMRSLTKDVVASSEISKASTAKTSNSTIATMYEQ